MSTPEATIADLRMQAILNAMRPDALRCASDSIEWEAADKLEKATEALRRIAKGSNDPFLAAIEALDALDAEEEEPDV